MSNYDQLLQMFEMSRDHNIYSMCSHEHDFMRYGALRGFFGYTNDNFMVNGQYLDQIVFRGDNYNVMDGRYHGYKFAPRLEEENMSSKISDYPSLTEIQVLLDDEMQEELTDISLKVWDWDYAFDGYSEIGWQSRPVVRSLNTSLMRFNAIEYPQKLYDYLIANSVPWCKAAFSYLNGYIYKAPYFRAANFHELLRTIQIAEVVSELNSHSPAELYYKIDLRNNVLLKNDGVLTIQDILNYEKYVQLIEETETEYFTHWQSKKQKILAVLYKTQEVRELLYDDIYSVPVKHYTEKEFATLFANAALNIGYAIVQGNPSLEELYTILGCTDIQSIRCLEKESKNFLLSCETLREVENYINTNQALMNHPEIGRIRGNIESARGAILNEYLGYMFDEYLWKKIPERHT